jgi:RNA polymerase sigma factor (sigma-70 family)
MKDGDLVIRFQNGEEQAFDELVRKHYPTTLNLLVRLAGNRMDADDLCQETFIRAYRSLRKFKAKSQFSTWLYRIAVNVANTHHRRKNDASFSHLATTRKPLLLLILLNPVNWIRRCGMLLTACHRNKKWY